MQTNFTQDDLILYIYNELSPLRRAAVRQAIETDPQIRSEYSALRDVTNSLDTMLMEPNPTTVEIILEHSHLLEQHQL